MTIIVVDGFEHGKLSGNAADDLYAAINPTTPSIVTDHAVAGYGTKALDCTTTVAGGSTAPYVQYENFSPTAAILVVGFHWCLLAHAGDFGIWLSFGSNSGSPRLDYINSTGKIALSGTTGVSSSFSPTIGVWYWITIRSDLSTTPGTNLLDWTITPVGGSPATQTQATTTGLTPGGTNNNMRLGMIEAHANANQQRFDNVIVSNDGADYPLSPVGIVGYSPNAVGTHNLDASPSQFFFKAVSPSVTALTTSETTSYQAIDDNPLDSDVDNIVETIGPAVPDTPTFRSAGTTTFSSNNVSNTSLTPGAPAGKAVGDLLVMVCTSPSNAYTITTPTGWAVVTGFPAASGTSIGGKIYALTRIADGTAADTPAVTFAGLTTGTTGTPASVTILAYQNLTDVLDGTVQVSDLSAQTTTSVIPAFTTATNNSMVIGVAVNMGESSGQTSTVATFTERVDQGTTSGTGYVFEVSDKVQAAHGSSGSATVTWSVTTSSRVLAVSFGLKSTTTSAQPTNTWYAEYNFADESTITQDPLAVRMIGSLATNGGISSVSTQLFDSVQGTNTETAIGLSSSNSIANIYLQKLFAQRPNSGGSWTLAALNGIRLRFGLTNDAGGAPSLGSTMLEAAYAVVTGSATTDSATVTIGLSVSSTDIVALVDASTVALLHNVAATVDTLQAIDSATASVLLSNSVVEGIVHTDASTATVGLLGTAADTAQYIEASIATLSLSGTAVEARTVTDAGSVQVTLTTSATDTAQFVDSGTALLDLDNSVVEGIVHTDAATNTVVLSTSSTDTAQFVDASTANVALTGSAADTAQFVDVGAANMILAGSAVEFVAKIDAATATITLLGTAADTAQFVDVNTATVALANSSTDIAQFVDTGAATLTMSNSVVEGIVHTDSGTGTVGLSTTATDTAQFVDASTATVTISNSVTEGIVHTEAATATVGLLGTATDTAQYVESTTVNVILSHTGAENYERSDSATSSIQLATSGNETAQFTDASTAVLGLINSDVSTFFGVDSTTAVLGINPSSSDVAAYIDALTVTAKLSASSTDVEADLEVGTATVLLVGSASDTAQFVDASQCKVTLTNTGVEGAILDAATSTVSLSSTSTDTAQYVDTATSLLQLTPSSTDSKGSTTSDSATTTLPLNASSTDTAQFVDANAINVLLTASASDSFFSSVADAGTISLKLACSTSDITQYTDSTTSNLALSALSSDIAAYIDSNLCSISLIASASDSISSGLTDANMSVLALSTISSDLAQYFDISQALLVLAPSIVETYTKEVLLHLTPSSADVAVFADSATAILHLTATAESFRFAVLLSGIAYRHMLGVAQGRIYRSGAVWTALRASASLHFGATIPFRRYWSQSRG